MAYSQAALATIAARPIIVVQERDDNKEVRSFSADFFAQYIDYIDRKATTVKGYFTCIRQFARWMDDNGITQPQRNDITAYRDYLTDSGLATGTQSQYLRAVKHFFKWTAAVGLWPNVGDGVHGAKVKNDCHKKDALPRNSVESIAGTIDRNDEAGKRLYAMYLLCVKCGLRTIEVHRADVGDIKTVDGDPYLYVQPKGHDGKDSPKYLFPDVKAALDDYLQTRAAEVKPKSPLFTATSNKGRPGTKIYARDEQGNYILNAKGEKVVDRISDGRIATTTISTMLKDVLVSAGFDSDRLTAHSLRATAATAAFEAGLTLFEVQQLMGHCDPATTEIYIKDQNRLQIEKKGRVAIDRYLKGELTPAILPELEAAIMTLTPDEQRELLEQIRAQKGDKTA